MMNRTRQKTTMSSHLLALLEGFRWLYLFVIGVGAICWAILFLQWLFATHWILGLITVVLLLAYSIGRCARTLQKNTINKS
jgi:hypothetical protein